jgi:S1-C subfamily serine protease
MNRRLSVVNVLWVVLAVVALAVAVRVIPADGQRGSTNPADPRPGGAIGPGDIIVAVDGRSVEGVSRLLSRLGDYRVGDSVRLTLVRDGRRIKVNVTLQAGSV